MPIYDIHEAKTHLSRLVDQAAQGEPFVIAKAGRPMVKVAAIDTPQPAAGNRFGFMAGQIVVPDTFNTMGSDAIAELFDGEA